MGLGKTVTALALIVANPVPPHRKILPRECLFALEKKETVEYRDYVPPPVAGPKMLLSNGSLIVVPMTLLR